MQRTKGIGISLPKEFMKRIDGERGDIPRSKYVLRILEKQYTIEEKNAIGSSDRGLVTLRSDTTVSQ
jgi:hypothetical protein